MALDFSDASLSGGGSSAAAGSAGLGTAGVAGSAPTGTGGNAGDLAGTGGSGGSSGGAPDATGGAAPDGSVDAKDPKDAAPDALCPSGGTALTFDGVSSRVTMPGTTLPTGDKARTVELWMKVKPMTPDWSPNHTVFEYGGTNTGTAFGVDMDMLPMMEVYVHPATTSLFFATGITQDQWFHLAVTYDGTNLRAFINGVEKGAKMMTANLATTMTPLNIGCSGTARYFFSGSIDELRVWNVARSGTEILQTMSLRLTGNEAGLVGYWRFDEGTGPAARDATSGGNQATLMGTTLPQWGASGVTLECP